MEMHELTTGRYVLVDGQSSDIINGTFNLTTTGSLTALALNAGSTIYGSGGFLTVGESASVLATANGNINIMSGTSAGTFILNARADQMKILGADDLLIDFDGDLVFEGLSLTVTVSNNIDLTGDEISLTPTSIGSPRVTVNGDLFVTGTSESGLWTSNTGTNTKWETLAEVTITQSGSPFPFIAPVLRPTVFVDPPGTVLTGIGIIDRSIFVKDTSDKTGGVIVVMAGAINGDSEYDAGQLLWNDGPNRFEITTDVENGTGGDILINAEGDLLINDNVRIGDTTNPTHALEVNGTTQTLGGRIKNTTRYTSTQSIPVTDDNIFCNGTFTVTLPTGVDGQTFRIINSGTGTITITSSENIAGSASDVILNAGDIVILTFETTDKWW